MRGQGVGSKHRSRQAACVLVSVAVVACLVLGLAGCTLFDRAPWRPSQPEPTDRQPGYVYRPATSVEGSVAVLYFPLADEGSILVPVSRMVGVGENVQLVHAAVQELLGGPTPGGGLAPVGADAADVKLSGVSVEGDQVYLVLSGARPSDRLLTHIYLTLAEQDYRLIQIFWEQDMICELGAKEEAPAINVTSPDATLRVYLPVATTTDESRRLYVVPATVNATATPTAAAGFVFSAVQKGTDTVAGTAFDSLVPALFGEEAEPPVVRISGTAAVVDFAGATVAAYEGGAAGEAALIDALTMTLTEFSTVETVEYRVDGGTTGRLFSSQLIETKRQRPLQPNPE